MMRTQTPKYVRPHTSVQCLDSFLAISLQYVTVMNIYSSMDAAIILCIWVVTAVCLYIQTLLVYDGVLEKCFWSPGKSWNFLKLRVGTL